MKTVIIVDSCCDLPLSFVENHMDVMDLIGMPVNLAGVEYVDDLGKELTHELLYQTLREGVMPSTAQINTYRFSKIFEKHVGLGKSVIYIGLSQAMSGTNNNAIQAIEMVREIHPSADIRILESNSASIGQGLLAVHAVKMAQNGIDAETIFKWLEVHQPLSNHWFAVQDLHYLKNGGRITSTQAAVGTLLNVKPILIVDENGNLKPYTKIKGRKKSIRFLADQLLEHYDHKINSFVLIGHGDAYEEAIALKALITPVISENKILITELSATIASHVGPEMLALGFIGTKRKS